MNFSTCVRMMLVLAVGGSVAWAGAMLISSPTDTTVAMDATTDVVVAAPTDSASAVSTLVAENTVGARIITVNQAPVVAGGLRGLRRRAGRLNLGARNVAALNAMPGGWWFRHSCFIP